MIFLHIFHFLLANLLCLANAFIFTSFIKWKNQLERIFVIGLFCCIQIFLVTMLCGFIGLLDKAYIMTLLLLFLFLVLFIVYIHKKKFSEIKPTKIPLKDNIGIFEKILLSFCFFELAWLFFIGFLFPPRAYDSLWYHLPSVIRWLSYRDIWFHPNSVVYSMVYPKNGEIFFFWNMIFLRSDSIVNLTQFFFLIGGTICVILISMELGLSYKYSLWSAAIFFFTPLLLIESVICYIDIILLTFMISSFYLFLRYLKSNKFIYLLIASISCGLGIGVKYSGAYLPVILIIFLLIHNLIKKQFFRRKIVYEVATIIFVSIIFGGYWYIVNLIEWHNPCWPIKISFAGIPLFQGPMTFLEVGVFAPFASAPSGYNNWGFFLKSILEKISHFYGISSIAYKGGFGPQFFSLGILSSIVILFKSIVSKRGNRIIFCVFFITMFLISKIKIPRYNLYIVCLSSISIGLVFEYIKNKKIWKILILLIVFYVFVMSFNHDFLTPHLIKDAFNEPLKEKRLMKTCNMFRKGEDNYCLCQKIRQHIPLGSNVLDAGTTFPYVLTENGFGRKLYYILPKNKKQWYHELHSFNIDFVVIKKSYHNSFDIVANLLTLENVLNDELPWIRQDTHTFSVIDSVANILIIKVGLDE